MSDQYASGDERICLDLCAGLGGLSQAFEDADGWCVVTVDINPEFDPDICADVLDLRPDDLPEADVVVGGPPCTTLSVAGNQTDHYVDGEPNSNLAREHVVLAYHVVGLCRALSPEWRFVENPRGRMRRYLGQPTGEITLCQYGYDWQKPTDLWGEHPPGLHPESCHPGNDACHHVKTKSYKEHGGGSDNRQGLLTESDAAERAKMPYELSAAILEAVEAAADQPTPVQQSLDEAVGERP